MADYETYLENMLACWNSTSEDELSRLAHSALEHNVQFTDPNHNIIGVDAFISMVKAVQAQVPGAVYARASAIDMQNNFCRYHWTVKKAGVLLLEGFDVTEVTDSGKITKVLGFFGALDKAA